MFTRRGLAALGLGAACLLLIGADAPKQTITARGLTFQAPSSWKSSKPSSQMRLAQLAVEPAKEGDDKAELTVYAFPGGAGSVDANVKRWREQFQDKDGNPPKIETEKRKGKNVDVTFAETSGRYIAAVRPGGSERFDKPDYRLLGAIVETDKVSYFLKMVGPDKTMKESKPAFDELIKSIEVEK